MQALLLAAGMGRRLGGEIHKCMLSVAGVSLFERMMNALRYADISRLVVVTGYRADELESFITAHSAGIEIVFIRNGDYKETNNIWSLYLAKEQFGVDDTILLESDLIFEQGLLKSLVDFPFQNAAVVAKLENWMDGTTVLLNQDVITKLIDKKDFDPNNASIAYKTVNIYKFSRDFLQHYYIPALESYIETYGKNQFYEMALKNIIEKATMQLYAFVLQEKWYEIDTKEDLKAANSLW